jgi:hypothetical protein
MSLAKWLGKNVDEISPRAAALIEERIAALRAVRAALKGEGKPLTRGNSMYADQVGDLVVKTPRGMGVGANPLGDESRNIKKTTKQAKRRGFLESILADNGLAPRTMLVETSKNKYMVQPKVAPNTWSNPEINESVAVGEKVKGLGMTARDLIFNTGIQDGKRKVFDAGEEYLLRATTPQERKSALEKFISYGKRAKPWLDE